MTAKQLARGYEIEKGTYVVVTDDELRALDPEKTRDINLRSFVDLDQISPLYFDHAYYLVPARGAGKAYGLLASVMEELGQAGIATFVITVTDEGTAKATGVRLFLGRTEAFFAMSATLIRGKKSTAIGVGALKIGRLQAGEAVVIHLTVRAKAPGVHKTPVRATADQPDTDLTDNLALLLLEVRR